MSADTAAKPATAPLSLSRGPNQAVIQACQRGDVKGLVAAFGGDADGLARFAIEMRRSSIATLGDYEAFVRRTDEGSLRMVIKPVALSTKDGTLYQIPAWRPVCREPDHECFGTAINTKGPNAHQGRHEWGNVVLEPTKAHISYPGYLAMNAVAGCAVGQPPSIIVDGETRTNPYVERSVRKDGRPGNIQRIVIGVVVVGPAPATGNPVVVNYTLDYDPSKDLAHMLAKVAEDHRDQCYLANEDEVAAAPKPGWAFLPISDGVGLWYDLRLDDVLGVYSDYVNLQGMALKKAQTVARRNAMRSHPALGGIAQSVVCDAEGRARVACVGWAPADGGELARWRELSERLARGLPLPQLDQIENIHDGATYDPKDEHDTAPDDDVVRPIRSHPPEQAGGALDPLTEERNNLIAYIDDGIGILEPRQVLELRYDPTAPVEELRRVKAELDRLVS